LLTYKNHVLALLDEEVNQIIDAINFEDIKARAIEKILTNKARGTQLNGILQK
jgi:hypothetical protein